MYDVVFCPDRKKYVVRRVGLRFVGDDIVIKDQTQEWADHIAGALNECL